MTCSHCSFENAGGMNFCGRCGTKLNRSVEPAVDLTATQPVVLSPPAATDDQSLITRYLTPQLSHKILATRGKIEGERRQVTALFADIKDYTSLSETIGEEATYRLMERLYEIMISSVYQEEGSVQKLTGDGIFALFGAPVALEDAPLRACRAGIAIQKMMQALGDELEKERNFRPMARIGIHTGPVVIGTVGTDLRMEFTALGDTINLASRMESIAEPGSVYISEATQVLAGPYIESTFIGEKQVKGKTEPQKVHRVDGLKSRAVRFDLSLQRGLTPLVGRSEELETLREYCETVCQGTTLLVQIVGEPGVGKSRLVHELHDHFRSKGLPYVRANCLSFGRNTSFLPFIEIVKNLLQINSNDDRRKIEEKITHELRTAEDEGRTPFLLNLLGFPVENVAFRDLDPKRVGDRTREAICTLLRSRCGSTPLVLVIEDLHWLDPASEDLITRLLADDDRLPLLILCTTRPITRIPWTGHSSAKEIKLASLPRESVLRMIRDLLGSEHIAEEVSRIIIEKSGCNPLFTEEMTRYLLDNGSLKRTEKALFYELAGNRMQVPATVLDLLQTRVDRLSDDQRTILQAASVIGQRFSAELANRVCRLGDRFDQNLHALVELELIYQEQGGESIEYRFKHALLQDVVYDGLLKPRKELLHQAVAEAIELHYTDRLRDWAEVLAHHWTQTPRGENAVRYIALSGEKSLHVYALEEAHEHFKQALNLAERTPGAVDNALWADMILNWARVFYFRTDHKGMIAALERFVPRMERSGDTRRLSLLLFWLGNAHSLGGRRSEAKVRLEKARALGDKLGDPECIGLAAAGLMWLYSYWVPDSKQSDAMVRHFFEQAEQQVAKTGDPFLAETVYFPMAIHSMMRQRYRESRDLCAKLMAFGERTRNDRCRASALVGLSFCSNFEERFQEALELADRSLRLSPDYFSRLLAKVAKAAAFALSGDISESLDMLTTAELECANNDFRYILGAVLIPRGAVMVLNGQMAKGVAKIKSAMEYWASLGNYTQPVWGQVLLGDIYLQMATGSAKPPFPLLLKNLGFILANAPVARRKARHHFEEVVNRSREYDMPGFLAKALYSLGVLAQTSEKVDQARGYFREALTVAERAELHLAGKIRTALTSL